MKYDYLSFRYNIMNISSLQTFANIKGRLNRDCKDVYFVRFLGVSSTYVSEIENMDRMLSFNMIKGNGKYNRVEQLPKMLLAQDIEFYSTCYDEWVSNGKKYIALKGTENSTELMCAIGKACDKVVNVLKGEMKNVSSSIEKNFVVKVLYWLDKIATEFMKGWNPSDSMKIVVSNVNKKQEYLFCYLLTLLGIDVALLQRQCDIDDACESMNLSIKVNIGSFREMKLAEYKYSFYNDEHKKILGQQHSKPQGVQQSEQQQNSQPRLSSVSIRRPERDRGTMRMESQQSQIALVRGGQNRQPSAQCTQVETTQNRPGVQQSRKYAQSEQMVTRSDIGASEMSFEELAQFASSVVMIAIHDRKGQVVGTGSGIMIGPNGYILTNHHVASGGCFYSVRIEDDNQIYKTDELIKHNPILDLAVIRINRRLNPLSFYRRHRPLVRGQKVVAIGSPLGLFNSVSDGIIAGFRKIHDVDMIQFTAPISHGSSGGAVLNMYGEVIGISTAGIDDGQNINLAVGYEYINSFIRGFT